MGYGHGVDAHVSRSHTLMALSPHPATSLPRGRSKDMLLANNIVSGSPRVLTGLHPPSIPPSEGDTSQRETEDEGSTEVVAHSPPWTWIEVID